ncbi:hypothetical protein, partial [Hafnia alvei]
LFAPSLGQASSGKIIEKKQALFRHPQQHMRNDFFNHIDDNALGDSHLLHFFSTEMIFFN